MNGHVSIDDAAATLAQRRATPGAGGQGTGGTGLGNRKPVRHRASGATRKPVTIDAASYIVEHLRERDRVEIFAQRWDDDEKALVASIMSWAGAMTWAWWRDGRPVSLQGAWPIRPGVWSCWAFGTDEWPRVVLSMTRHSRRFIIPALLRAQFHRAEALALASHTDSRRWIEALGARQESILKAYGRNGEDFVMYRWMPDDVQRFMDRTK